MVLFVNIVSGVTGNTEYLRFASGGPSDAVIGRPTWSYPEYLLSGRAVNTVVYYSNVSVYFAPITLFPTSDFARISIYGYLFTYTTIKLSTFSRKDVYSYRFNSYQYKLRLPTNSYEYYELPGGLSLEPPRSLFTVVPTQLSSFI